MGQQVCGVTEMNAKSKEGQPLIPSDASRRPRQIHEIISSTSSLRQRTTSLVLKLLVIAGSGGMIAPFMATAKSDRPNNWLLPK